MIGLPNRVKALRALLLPYKPEGWDEQSFERDVYFIQECNFLSHRVDLDNREVKKPETLHDVQFMYGRTKELAEVDKKFCEYLLEKASQMVVFLSAEIQKFAAVRRLPVDMMCLPEYFFKFYGTGGYLFGVRLEKNFTRSTVRLYSEPKYGQYAEVSLDDAD